MKTNNLLLAASFIVGSVMALSPIASASAADAMTFHGAICRVFDPAKAGQVQTHHSGVINTSATSSVVVTCPLTRDSTTDINGANVIVKGFRNATAIVPFSCTFISNNINGSTLTSNTQQSVAVGAISLSLNVATSGVNGYYAITCTLPEKSIIRGLVLTE
jgi:hypothetical protein